MVTRLSSGNSPILALLPTGWVSTPYYSAKFIPTNSLCYGSYSMRRESEVNRLAIFFEFLRCESNPLFCVKCAWDAAKNVDSDFGCLTILLSFTGKNRVFR